MSAAYAVNLDKQVGARMRVEFKTLGPGVVDYSVVLLLMSDDGAETVRLYDGAHGVNELHRYTQSTSKQPADVFHSGTLGEGMRSAIEQVKDGYLPMIESWRAR